MGNRLPPVQHVRSGMLWSMVDDADEILFLFDGPVVDRIVRPSASDVAERLARRRGHHRRRHSGSLEYRGHASDGAAVGAVRFSHSWHLGVVGLAGVLTTLAATRQLAVDVAGAGE